MPFADEDFDAVVCNATLEHDRHFWKTVGEIHRVTRPGGAIIVGIPGYAPAKHDLFKRFLKRTPLAGALLAHPLLGVRLTGTPTFEIHNHPGDYYRFSPQAMVEVLLADLDQIAIRTIMQPPRLIGSGVKRS